jgi:hypothetical protein
MTKSVFLRLPAYGLLVLSLLGLSGCYSEVEVADSSAEKAIAIDLVEPPCAEPGSEAGYIEGNGFGAENVTITVGGIPAEVLAATGMDASFVVPFGIPPGDEIEVVVVNPGGRIATIKWESCRPDYQPIPLKYLAIGCAGADTSLSRRITLDEAGTIYIALYCDGGWVRVLKSEDAGITFAQTSSPNLPVGGDTSILGDMHILGGASGEIFLAATADGSVVNFTKSVNGGQSWAPLVYVDAAAGDYMAMRLINDALYLSFGGKLFRSASRGDEPWTGYPFVGDAGSSDILTDGSRVIFAYGVSRPAPLALYVRVSADDGLTFGAPMLLANASGAFPPMAYPSWGMYGTELYAAGYYEYVLQYSDLILVSSPPGFMPARTNERQLSVDPSSGDLLLATTSQATLAVRVEYKAYGDGTRTAVTQPFLGGSRPSIQALGNGLAAVVFSGSASTIIQF